jgi:hypothetical protein
MIGAKTIGNRQLAAPRTRPRRAGHASGRA